MPLPPLSLVTRIHRETAARAMQLDGCTSFSVEVSTFAATSSIHAAIHIASTLPADERGIRREMPNLGRVATSSTATVQGYQVTTTIYSRLAVAPTLSSDAVTAEGAA